MPVIPTYPGVYIEEISSGVRTITGVATSITAFIGFALKGPTNEPIRIQSFGDFQRKFGGLTLDSTISYAVQQFFLNGGSDAAIVRLSNPGKPAILELESGKLKLKAATPGIQGNQLRVTIDTDGIDSATQPNLFNLTIAKDDQGTVTTIETLKSINFNSVQKTVAAKSKSIRVMTSTLTARPSNVSALSFTNGGEEGAKTAKLRLKVSKDKADADVDQVLVLTAASEGAWGNKLKAIVDYETGDDASVFNLTIQYVDGDKISSEKIRRLSMDASATRYIVEVLRTESEFVRIENLADDLPDGAGRPDEIASDEAIEVNVADVRDKGEDGTISGAEGLFDGLYLGNEDQKTGLYALEKADLFNLLCIPPATRDSDTSIDIWSAALVYCAKRRAMLIIDPPVSWETKDKAINGLANFRSPLGKNKNNAAIFFPRVKLADPLKENRIELFPPCGVMAGIFARTDAQRGIWKAPAGIDAGLTGVRGLQFNLTDGENGQLNPLGVNCLRFFNAYGNVVWGARTLDGDDRAASEWKYIPVRRLALFLEESLYRGTQWVVFEPNDEPLWAQIRLNLGAFMNNLFRQGAFQGKTPKEAYFVKCDKETTTQNDINLGIVNIIVGFAPLKPAEFVIIKFQQITGQIDT
jgi:uncharacterized protein